MPKTAAVLPNPNEQTWLDHLRRCRRESPSLAEYARSNHLKISQLYAWKARLEARGLWKDETSVSFLPVTVLDAPASDTGIRLRLPNGVVLEFTSTPDPAFLMNQLKLAAGLP